MCEMVTLTAAEIMKDTHPVYSHFKMFCEKKGTPMTKRQAREFLKKFPTYKVAQDK